MITSEEFESAMKLILDYKIQSDKILYENNSAFLKIDIQKNINRRTFLFLQRYYKLELNIYLEWDDLKAIDINILKNIDYVKLRNYRGFGKKAEYKLKEVINLKVLFH